MRASLMLPALAGLLLTLPLATRAEAPPQYQVVTPWPLRSPKPPKYGRGEVSAVASDAQGNVYVLQRIKPPVLVFSRDGRFLRSWGSNVIRRPHGGRIDPDGNLWVTDLKRQQVLKFTTGGQLLAAFGVEGQKGSDDHHFNQPTDIAFSPSGDVYITDGYGNSRVVRLSHDGQFLGSWGSHGHGTGQFDTPHSVAVDAEGRVYVVDRGNSRIQIFDADGNYLTQWAGMGYLNSICITPDQKLLAAEGSGATITLYGLDRTVITRWGSHGRQPGQFQGPHMVGDDDQAAVYVAEVDGQRVQKFTAR